MTMRKRFVIALLLIVIGFGGAAFLKRARTTTPTGDNSAAARPLTVATATASDLATTKFTVTAAGTVASESEAALVATTTGTVTFVGTDIGRTVGTGQTLFRIDTTGGSGDTDLAAARLRADNARKNYDDARRTDEKVDSLTSKNARDRAANERAIADLAYSDVLDRRVVKSPITGTLTARDVSVGDTVTVGTPLATVSRGKKIVRFYVSGDERALLTTGQHVVVSRAAGATDGATGTIVRIGSVADAASRRFLVEAESRDGAFADIPAGSVVTVTATVTRTAKDGAFFLPIAALSQDASGSAIFAYVDGHAVRRAVTVIAIQGETVEVTGISSDTAIITEGARLLHDGVSVTRS